MKVQKVGQFERPLVLLNVFMHLIKTQNAIPIIHQNKIGIYTSGKVWKHEFSSPRVVYLMGKILDDYCQQFGKELISTDKNFKIFLANHTEQILLLTWQV